MRIPYQLTPGLCPEIRHAQMAKAIQTGFPRLREKEIEDGKSISIACYGPSLLDTWEDITPPIISVSGALHFLNEKGITVQYHVDCDPREHKTKHIEPPVPGVHYLMGSCCHPRTWEILKGERVSLVHFYMSTETEKWIGKHDPWQIMIRPGSTVGMAAIHVGGLLGYRHFEIHGMDGSIRNGLRHAGPHYGHKQGGYTWDAGGKTYQTSQIMANSCAEMINSLYVFPIFCVFHGDGLLQALIDEEYGLDNAALVGSPKAEMVRKARISFMEAL